MEMLGYAAAIGIGVLLGLMGGGGSILTVPVLVYLMSVSPVTATACSLFVVGISSFVGGIYYMKKKMVSYTTALFFAVPSLIAVYLTRKFMVPMIPELILDTKHFTLTRDSFIMILFAILMITVFVYMVKSKSTLEGKAPAELRLNYILIVVEAIAVGLVTGIVGIGGGFLITPSLVGLVKLPMKRAIGTSLLIIAANSLVGFLGDLGAHEINWIFLLAFTAFSLIGIGIGVWMSHFISGRKLKPAFGWLVLSTGVFILFKELILN